MYKKNYDRRKRSELAARLRHTMSCIICNIKFTKMEVGKRTLCYKASCEYLHSLQQADSWRVRAEKARIRMEIEHGTPACLDATDSPFTEKENYMPSQDFEEEHSISTSIMDAGTVTPAAASTPTTSPPPPSSYPCPYRSCINTLDADTLQRMKSGDIPQPVCMGLDGGTIGVCSFCPMPTYWCGKHYKDHSLHALHVHSGGSMYTSNDPVPSPPIGVLPTSTALQLDQLLLPSLDASMEHQLDLDLSAGLDDVFASIW